MKARCIPDRIRRIRVSLAAFGLLAAAVGHAQGSGALAELARGRQFTAHGDTYQLLPGVSALAGTDANSVRLAMDRIGAEAPSQIASRGRYVVYRRGQTQPPADATLRDVGMVRIHPTAINTRTGAIGVLLETIQVRVRNFAERKSVASAHKLRIDTAFPEQQMIYLKVPKGRDILEVVAALAADPRVASVAPELLDNVRIEQ